jgi:hypothetical protein
MSKIAERGSRFLPAGQTPTASVAGNGLEKANPFLRFLFVFQEGQTKTACPP